MQFQMGDKNDNLSHRSPSINNYNCTNSIQEETYAEMEEQHKLASSNSGVSKPSEMSNALGCSGTTG